MAQRVSLFTTGLQGGTVKRQGMAMAGVLVTSLATALLFLLAFQISSAQQSTTVQAQRKAAQLVLQHFVKENIDCKAALYPSGSNCSDGTWLDSKDRTGSFLSQGDAGAVTIGQDYALRVKCQQNPVPALKVEFSIMKAGAPQTWSDLYDGVPYTCPPDAPAPVGCTTVDTTVTLIQSQIATALGLPANRLVVQDGFHGHMVCRKAGYSIATNHVYKATGPSSFCSGKKIVAWNKLNNAWAITDACNAALYLDSVTCRYKETGSCPCPAQKSLGPTNQSAASLAAAHFANMAYRGSFRYDCFSYPGNIVGVSRFTCPAMHSGADTTKKICLLLGYSKVNSFTTRTYGSCSDNAIAKWNTSTNAFDVVPACSANSMIQTITCADPIAGACDSFY